MLILLSLIGQPDIYIHTSECVVGILHRNRMDRDNHHFINRFYKIY
jgi:hypothetical protein